MAIPPLLERPQEGHKVRLLLGRELELLKHVEEALRSVIAEIITLLESCLLSPHDLRLCRRHPSHGVRERLVGVCRRIAADTGAVVLREDRREIRPANNALHLNFCDFVVSICCIRDSTPRVAISTVGQLTRYRHRM